MATGSMFRKFREVWTCRFWATDYKTVRPMLSDRCLSVCLSCLSVTLVYCGQTAGWIKMKLGTEVGLGTECASAPATLCYMGTQLPKERNTTPNFRPMSVVAKRLGGLRCHLVCR